VLGQSAKAVLCYFDFLVRIFVRDGAIDEVGVDKATRDSFERQLVPVCVIETAELLESPFVSVELATLTRRTVSGHSRPSLLEPAAARSCPSSCRGGMAAG